MTDQPRYTLSDLLYLMTRLRDPKSGCPWDVKQTYSSITKSTIEEAYEVVDAIERGDYLHLREELGDLLFQVVFYSQLAKEDELYDFNDVAHTLVAKLIRRHPHVFPDGTLESVSETAQLTESDIKASWEEIKKEERTSKGKTALLDDVPRSLPSMTRAVKLQKRAASVGFDWPNSEPVFDKLMEEVAELKVELELELQAKSKIEEELGDVLFTLVNLARHHNLDPEETLRKANAKFVRRFEFVEESIESTGDSLKEASVSEMEQYWQDAKKKGL